MRSTSITSELRRVGFRDPTRAGAWIADPMLDSFNREQLIDQLGASPDPDQALLALLRLCEVGGHTALMDEDNARNVYAILGMSTMLGDYLVSHPELIASLNKPELVTDAQTVRRGALNAVSAHDGVAGIPGKEGIDALRAYYYAQLLHIAAYDLTSPNAVDVMPDVSRAISNLVDATIEAGLALARAEIPQSNNVKLAVIAMGKTGARELNYISDVDVIYAAQPQAGIEESQALAIAAQMATYLGKVMNAASREPVLFELDANLRPEGRDGPLVRTVASHKSYYERWAKGWEFQALLKARFIAGDSEVGEDYIATMAPMVWTAANSETFVEDSRAMRQRVESLVPKNVAGRQLKLGEGGLRDVEFTVQLLQLVHGRTDPTLRVKSTLEAIDALSEGGYIARNAARRLNQHYRFLRTFEHRIQLLRMRRSHLVPTAEAELRRIARSLRPIGITGDDDLIETWERTKRDVRALHLEIYYRPLLPQVARLNADEITLEPEAAEARLAAIGFMNPRAALRNLAALTSGVSRTATIQKHVLPVMIGWMAEGPEPDHGLAAFRTISEAMGGTPWYMRMLRDSAFAAQRLARILSTSRYVAQALPSLSEAITWLDNDELLAPKSREDLEEELTSMLARRNDPKSIAISGRYLRRREILRTSMAEVLRLIDDPRVHAAVSNAGDIAVSAAHRAALLSVGAELADHAVIAMGRFGGNEISYSSDADVMFVFRPREGVADADAAREANEVAKETINFLTMVDEEPPFVTDADLRPEGRNGPLSRSVTSYAEYYSRWVQTWEIQALLRARLCAGDESVGRDFFAVVDPLRYPAGGLTDKQTRDIRAMKARVERERIPRGVDPSRHLKLGRGGLSDVEWTVQLLQLRYAGRYETLRQTGTRSTLLECQRLGLVCASDADRLIKSWELASWLRDANVLATGRAQGAKNNVLAHESHELAVIAALAGINPAHRRDIEENYLRAARLSRDVVRRLFYGE